MGQGARPPRSAAASGSRSSSSPSTGVGHVPRHALARTSPSRAAPAPPGRRVAARRAGAGPARRARAPGRAAPARRAGRPGRPGAAPPPAAMQPAALAGVEVPLPGEHASPRSRITTTVVSPSTQASMIACRTCVGQPVQGAGAPEEVLPADRAAGDREGQVGVRGEPLDHERASVREPDPFQAGPGLALVSCQRHPLDGVQQDLSRRHLSTMAPGRGRHHGPHGPRVQRFS